jgi:8-oxo-dGTP pyrophosphatase MutT (NUDIX family)
MSINEAIGAADPIMPAQKWQPKSGSPNMPVEQAGSHQSVSNDAEGGVMESISPDELATRLTTRLSDSRVLPKPRMSPELSYGRHRGPAPAQSRVAAVAVALYFDPESGWTLPLTLRPSTLQHHGGQVCLPGGRLEPGENPLQAALREFEEELGVAPGLIADCGELSRQYVYASGNLVHPVVTIIEPPGHSWVPDPSEVDEVIPLPVAALLDPRRRQQLTKRRVVRVKTKEVDRLVFRADAFQYDRHMVWGATALILDQLAQILQNQA